MSTGLKFLFLLKGFKTEVNIYDWNLQNYRKIESSSLGVKMFVSLQCMCSLHGRWEGHCRWRLVDTLPRSLVWGDQMKTWGRSIPGDLLQRPTGTKPSPVVVRTTSLICKSTKRFCQPHTVISRNPKYFFGAKISIRFLLPNFFSRLVRFSIGEKSLP